MSQWAFRGWRGGRALRAALDLAWLDAARAAAWATILFVVSILAAAGWVLFSRHGIDVAGKPLGSDFVSFWTAARLVLTGAPPEAVYDPVRHAAFQAAAFPASRAGFAPFPYPPPFLLICLPFGRLPYLAALAVWLVGSGAAALAVVRSWSGPGLLVASLAFPAVLINIANGQNGFLTTALFGLGALWLRRRPYLAGLCLGALIFKPQLGILIPVVLLASRNWRAFAAACVASLGLIALSILAFGLGPWRAYPAELSLLRAVTEQGALAGKVQSLFETARLLGAASALAYGLQAGLSLGVAGAVGWLAWRRPWSEALGPALIAASLLASPYLLDYDLMLAAIPLAWLFRHGAHAGFRPGERPAMLAAYLLPLLSRIVAQHTGLMIAPFVHLSLLAVLLHRAFGADGRSDLSVQAAPAPAA